MLKRLATMGIMTDAATSDDFRNGSGRFRRGRSSRRSWQGQYRQTGHDRWADVGSGCSNHPRPPATSRKPRRPPAAPRDRATPRPTGQGKPCEECHARDRTCAADVSGVGARNDRRSGLRRRVRTLHRRRSRRGSAAARLGERSGRLDESRRCRRRVQRDHGPRDRRARRGPLGREQRRRESKTSTVHKLQLISGRVLFSIPLPDEAGPGRFTDVAVTPQSVLVLDGEGRRVYRAAKKGKYARSRGAPGGARRASLAAAASDGIAYVAYDDGVLKVDLDVADDDRGRNRRPR